LANDFSAFSRFSFARIHRDPSSEAFVTSNRASSSALNAVERVSDSAAESEL